MPSLSRPRRTIGQPLLMAAATVLAGTIGLTFHVDSILRTHDLASELIGTGLWRATVAAAGGKTSLRAEGLVADVPLLPLLIASGCLSVFAWLAGAGWIVRRRQVPYTAALGTWGRYGWLWWLLPVAWELSGTALEIVGSPALHLLWRKTLPLCHSLLWSGWLTTVYVLSRRPADESREMELPRRTRSAVWVAIAVWFIGFSAMNWMLYESLLIPHGDSAMYEEHVWNLLHGKGFRSYLDHGRLFLGEHVQVIHLLVIPLYVFWPSHLLLELCQSAVLALGAIPVFHMAQRHSRSATAATLLALAYLLYTPMQFLDIAVTLKTFRPNSFEITFLLFGIDALERRRNRALVFWLAMCLLCQEDAATVIAPLGLWIAFQQPRFVAEGALASASRAGTDGDTGRRRTWFGNRPAWFGSGMALFAVLYVVLVIKVVLPWFRGGADVHFAQYFSDLGATSGEIARNIALHPGLVAGRLLSVESLSFSLQLLAPLGFLPLLSPWRLAVGAPLFAMLCLSPITNSAWHHFHAPLVPILFWAAAAGLANAAFVFEAGRDWWGRRRRKRRHAAEPRCRIPLESFIASGRTLPAEPDPRVVACPVVTEPPAPNARVVMAVAFWSLGNAFFSGLPVTLTPLGISFWDSESRAYWKNLYVPGERARRFPEAFALIPRDSRVASTDYIHPRFTHHARSYDYSEYPRKDPNGVDYLEDAEYIVIDTRHPYSKIRRPGDVKEYREEPEKWELLEDQTEGYFIVLKRRRVPPAR